MQNVNIENTKKGEYLKRTATARGVYVRGEYCRTSKGYACHDVEDVNRVIYVKKGKPVFIGFTY
jgi:hypothetical protein